MAEIPPEQVDSQYKGHAPLFNQQTPGASASASATARNNESKTAPRKGLVLDKDGKPCRLCTDAASWRSLTKQAKSESTPDSKANISTAMASSFAALAAASSSSSSPSPSTTTPTDCPPDVEALGRSTWTLLHSMAATYPEKADSAQQRDMRGFLTLFSRLYPCWVCADDFQAWMAHPSGRNQPRLGSRAEFGWWMCEAHNEVNRKLGKKEFDCRFWEERWRTGWKDGRCD
ncbi:hypothetical protein NUU61_000793 [Penicillium alfredii]|uniref:Sulfhydryl oxidase n=1 Tax=Penicillium alfredii TaxID=1506179 RepID=A0A9W9KQ24_9EURO|nr:uncharacterized protein NUU61_000793 [Penicillium alfredii]KAJ5115034.1 hypothetical protein NUU61_000793 [Penicillium alfredii]